jgi:hypothetical protein
MGSLTGPYYNMFVQGCDTTLKVYMAMKIITHTECCYKSFTTQVVTTKMLQKGVSATNKVPSLSDYIFKSFYFNNIRVHNVTQYITHSSCVYMYIHTLKILLKYQYADKQSNIHI